MEPEYYVRALCDLEKLVEYSPDFQATLGTPQNPHVWGPGKLVDKRSFEKWKETYKRDP